MRHVARILLLILGSAMLCLGQGASEIGVGQPSESPPVLFSSWVTFPMPPENFADPVFASGETTVTSSEPPEARTTVIGGSDEQRAIVDWALERYADADLDLPVLHLHLYPDVSDCSGNRGFFSPSSNPWTIAICTEERLVALHEIGHAWAEHTLTADDRVAYVEHRRMESWNDPGTQWSSRGSEDAANTLAWGLLDTPVRVVSSSGPLAERSEAFRFLTGAYSPRIVD